MEGSDFDAVARRLGRRVGRRTTLRALASVVLGRASTSIDAGAATCSAVGRTCTSNGQCCTNFCASLAVTPRGPRRCACPTGTTLCKGQCRNLQTDRNNCGRCGNVCLAGDICVDGRCQCAEDPGCCSYETCSGGACQIAGGRCRRANSRVACVRTMSGSVLQIPSACEWNDGNPICGSDADCAAVCPPGATCYCSVGQLNWYNEWEDFRHDNCEGLCVAVGC